VETLRIKSLPNPIRCPRCGSTRVGLLREAENDVAKIAEKKGKNLRGREQRIFEEAEKTAELLDKYGFPAAVALVGHRLKPRDVEKILERESKLTDHFYELIVEAEKEALKRRFW
jgi:ATP-dependent Lhr-like helicase